MNYVIEPREKFLVGSRAFFDVIDGFVSKDRDELWILEKPVFKFSSLILKLKDRDVILYPPFSKEELIAYDLEKDDRMKFGKYIVPKFAEYIGLTIDDLKGLSKMMDNLDEKHQYEKVIYEAYIANNSFTLNDEQLKAAYESYKSSREKK